MEQSTRREPLDKLVERAISKLSGEVQSEKLKAATLQRELQEVRSEREELKLKLQQKESEFDILVSHLEEVNKSFDKLSQLHRCAIKEILPVAEQLKDCIAQKYKNSGVIELDQDDTITHLIACSSKDDVGMEAFLGELIQKFDL